MGWRRGEAPVVVFKFAVEPLGPVPEGIWERAQAMRRLWNRWVCMRREVCGMLSEGRRVIEQGQARDWWQQLTACIERDARESGLPQNWHWALRQRFNTACRAAPERRQRALRLGASPSNPHLGGPSYQYRLSHVCLPWYYGDRRSLRQCVSRSEAFRLDALPDAGVYSGNSHALRRARQVTGWFGIPKVGGFPFRVNLHREVPEGAVVKHVEMVGRYVVPHDREQAKPREWEWSLCLFLEFPDGLSCLEATGRVAGLDVGWRRFEDYIRVAVVADNTGGVHEVRLPLDMSTNQTRGYRLHLPETWEEVYALDAEIGRRVDEAKAEVRGLLVGVELPAEVRQMLAGLQKMRQGGLMRLGLALEECSVAAAQDAAEVITHWQGENDRLRHVRNDAATRMVNRRVDVYRQVACWLAETYDEVRWEEGLGVQEMGAGEKDVVLEAADRTRQIAAPSNLRAVVANAMRRRGRTVCGRETAGSTRCCYECGAEAESGPSLYLTCPNGHTWDQDINAARNLLGETGAAEAGTDVPARLRAFLVRLR